jgi:UDP-glucose 4-epimerase
MEKVLITGGAGFIGAALANYIESANQVDITAVDNLSAGDWGRLSPKIKHLSLDIAKITTNELEELLSGVDTLFHLAAVKLHNEKNSFNDILSNNISATQKLFEAAGKSGVKNIVFTSSLYTYGMLNRDLMHETDLPRPTTSYGASKLFGENLLAISSEKYGFKYSIARLFFMYGENQYSPGGYKSVVVSNFERLKNGKPAFISGDGNQILDYLYVGDCVNALAALSKKPNNEVFNLSSAIPLTIKELTHKMIDTVGGGRIEYVAPDWTAGTRRVGGNRKLTNAIDWLPQVSLEEGLNLTWRNLIE